MASPIFQSRKRESKGLYAQRDQLRLRRDELLSAADKKRQEARQVLGEVGDDNRAALNEFGDAIEHVGHAGDEVIDGSVDVIQGTGHAVAGAVYETGAVALTITERPRYAVADFLERVAADLRAPSAKRLHAKAKWEFAQSRAEFASASAHYAQSLHELAAAGGDISDASHWLESSAEDFIRAASKVGDASVRDLAALNQELAQAVVSAKIAGVLAYRDLAMLNCEVSAKLANALANTDQGKVHVSQSELAILQSQVEIKLRIARSQ
jgi:hypothetical protein